MTTNRIISDGQYLGFCTDKGYLYTICKGTTHNNIKEYEIWAVRNGQSSFLINFTGK